MPRQSGLYAVRTNFIEHFAQLATSVRRLRACKQRQHLRVGLVDRRPYFARSDSILPCSMNWSGHPMRTTGTALPDLLQRFDDGRTEAAHLHVIFKGDKRGDAPRVVREHLAIDRFHEARIDDGGGESFALQTLAKFAREVVIGPGPRIATSEPSLSTSALPTGIACGSGLHSTPATAPRG